MKYILEPGDHVVRREAEPPHAAIITKVFPHETFVEIQYLSTGETECVETEAVRPLLTTIIAAAEIFPGEFCDDNPVRGRGRNRASGSIWQPERNRKDN